MGNAVSAARYPSSCRTQAHSRQLRPAPPAAARAAGRRRDREPEQAERAGPAQELGRDRLRASIARRRTGIDLLPDERAEARADLVDDRAGGERQDQPFGWPPRQAITSSACFRCLALVPRSSL